MPNNKNQGRQMVDKWLVSVGMVTVRQWDWPAHNFIINTEDQEAEEGVLLPQLDTITNQLSDITYNPPSSFFSFYFAFLWVEPEDKANYIKQSTMQKNPNSSGLYHYCIAGKILSNSKVHKLNFNLLSLSNFTMGAWTLFWFTNITLALNCRTIKVKEITLRD